MNTYIEYGLTTTVIIIIIIFKIYSILCWISDYNLPINKLAFIASTSFTYISMQWDTWYGNYKVQQ